MPNPDDRARARRGLRIPARLAFTIVLADLAAGCPQSSASDAGDVIAEQTVSDAAGDAAVDALADIAPTDAADDVPEDCQAVPYMEGYFECFAPPGSDAGPAACGQTVCAASMCQQGCVACPTRMYEPTGYACLAPADGGGNTACEAAGRVCNATDCPTGCQPCIEPVYCSPDPSADVPVANCDPQYVCDATGCPAGCTPLV